MYEGDLLTKAHLVAQDLKSSLLCGWLRLEGPLARFRMETTPSSLCPDILATHVRLGFVLLCSLERFIILAMSHTNNLLYSTVPCSIGVRPKRSHSPQESAWVATEQCLHEHEHEHDAAVAFSFYWSCDLCVPASWPWSPYALLRSPPQNGADTCWFAPAVGKSRVKHQRVVDLPLPLYRLSPKEASVEVW